LFRKETRQPYTFKKQRKTKNCKRVKIKRKMESKLCREQKNRKKERKRKPQEYESQVFATLKKERKYRIPTAEKIC